MKYTLWHHDETTLEDYVVHESDLLDVLIKLAQNMHNVDTCLWIENQSRECVWEITNFHLQA